MEIVDRRQPTGTIDFGNLEFGDVFQDEDGDICIKMDNDYSFANAVVLSSGCAFKCELDTPVIPLTVELTIINNK